jgi:hypothetical protein
MTKRLSDSETKIPAMITNGKGQQLTMSAHDKKNSLFGRLTVK